MSVLLHPHTASQLSALATEPPQALILYGPEGSGKLFTARSWLEEEAQIAPANIRVILPLQKSSISVNQVRELYHATRTKQAERQFFILDGVGSMSPGAQNAFLKLLEEPNSSIYFILTTHTLENVLPTIRSRAQQVAISPIHNKPLLGHLQDHYQLDAASLQQIVFISRGRVGLATTLATDSEMFTTYRQLAATAKQVLGGTSFDRLASLTAISDRTQALTFLEITAAMASMLLQKANQKEEQVRWTTQLAVIHDTLERLSANANIKIQMTRLALAL